MQKHKKEKYRKGKSKSRPVSSGKAVSKQKKVESQHLFLILAAVLTVTFISFYPSLQNDFTNWDDPTYVTDNEMVTSISSEHIQEMFHTPVSANYHPLTMLSLAVNYSFSGMDPTGYHVTNLLFHLLNVLLVFIFIYRLSDKKLIPALIVSLFFGIHPLHVESVAWISERKDVLYTFFYIASLIVYLQYTGSRKIQLLLFASLLFFLSCLSKAVAVTLPVVFFLIDWYRGRKFDLRCILEKIPLLLISVWIGLKAVKAQETVAIAEFETFTLWQHTMFSSYGFIMYIVKLFIPVKLSAFYPYPNLDEIGNLPMIFYLAPFIVIGIFGFAFLSWKKTKTKTVLFGLIFYFLTIALVLQFISVGRAIMADRYTYIPYIGLFFIIALTFHRVWNSSNKRLASFRYPFAATLGIYTVIFAAVTYGRTKVWENSDTLWTDVINKYPQVEVAYKNRGNYHGKKLNNPDRAMKDYKILMAMETKDPEVYNNLGNIYGLKKEFKKSLAAYDKAISLDKNYFEAYINRAMTHSKMKQFEKALSDYEKALQLRPGSMKVISKRAYTYLQSGDIEKSLAGYNYLIRTGAWIENLYFNRGIALYSQGKLKEALNDFLANIRVNPGFKEAYFNASFIFYKLEDYKNAYDYAIKAKSMGYPLQDKYMNDLRKKLNNR